MACLPSLGWSQASSSGLRYYGFALVDCQVPDRSARSNYTTEVAGFTNVAHLCVFTPDELLSPRVQLMQQQGLQPIIAVQNLLFSMTPEARSPSGYRMQVRADFQRRWNLFLKQNLQVLTSGAVAALYVADEPFWHQMDQAAFTSVVNQIKADLPKLPLMLIEAVPALEQLKIPQALDWIGFDLYGIPQPDRDQRYLQALELLKKKRSRHDQQIWLVMETQWLPSYGAAGYAETALAEVAEAYYRLARQHKEVIGLIGYAWPGGFDEARQKGARDLPALVRERYRKIGLDILAHPANRK